MFSLNFNFNFYSLLLIVPVTKSGDIIVSVSPSFSPMAISLKRSLLGKFGDIMFLHIFFFFFVVSRSKQHTECIAERGQLGQCCAGASGAVCLLVGCSAS